LSYILLQFVVDASRPQFGHKKPVVHETKEPYLNLLFPSLWIEPFV
jgi:hypothetical protein